MKRAYTYNHPGIACEAGHGGCLARLRMDRRREMWVKGSYHEGCQIGIAGKRRALLVLVEFMKDRACLA